MQYWRYLFQSGYDNNLIKVGLGMGEDTCIALLLFNLWLLGCQSFKRNSFMKQVKIGHWENT
jgi:hypothetical protein